MGDELHHSRRALDPYVVTATDERALPRVLTDLESMVVIVLGGGGEWGWGKGGGDFGG